MIQEPPPEFKLLLAGLTDENDRRAVINAYYGMADGDPNTLPVQFAVLLKAHTLAMLKIAEGHAEVVRGAELVKGVSTLHSKVDRVNDGIRTLSRTSSIRTAFAMAVAYGLGFASYPLLTTLLGWLSRAVAANG
ncbi:MAG: hypothetical protein JO069_00370 [Verrucomicrobia bacterium]|nr:hypothetical protein [Verrucomicrobiota bacterium]